MRMKFRLLMVSGLLCMSGSVFAQCAAGIPSGGNPLCVPPAVYYGNSGDAASSNDAPRVKWQKRWGATAYDEKTGVFAAVRSSTSKKKAEKAAIEMCRQKGGSPSCTSWAVYYNQCVSVVESASGLLTSSTGPSLEITAKRALKNCSAQTDGCVVKYTDCTYAARVY